MPVQPSAELLTSMVVQSCRYENKSAGIYLQGVRPVLPLPGHPHKNLGLGHLLLGESVGLLQMWGEGVPAGEEIGSVGFWTCKRTDVTEVTKMARPEENLRRHLSLKESKSVKRKVSYTTCTNSLLILYKILFSNINILKF